MVLETSDAFCFIKEKSFIKIYTSINQIKIALGANFLRSQLEI